jgi:ribosomal protein S18 acetylase RimI-like enzyme
LEIVEVSPDLERQFMDAAEKDYCDYYFFIYDWLLQRTRTCIYMALEGAVVAGLMVIFDGHIAQLRGDREAVELLLKELPPQVADVQVPVDCEELLNAKYPQPKLKANVTLMHLERVNGQFFINQKPERLIASDACDIAELMHEANVALWGDISAEAVAALFSVKEALWLGIKREGKLASFGYAMLTPKMCHVTWIATRPGYERLGYATSIASSLAKACLDVSEGAVIYVMNDNAVAKRIYSKIGFRSYKQYVFVKV